MTVTFLGKWILLHLRADKLDARYISQEMARNQLHGSECQSFASTPPKSTTSEPASCDCTDSYS